MSYRLWLSIVTVFLLLHATSSAQASPEDAPASEEDLPDEALSSDDAPPSDGSPNEAPLPDREGEYLPDERSPIDVVPLRESPPDIDAGPAEPQAGDDISQTADGSAVTPGDTDAEPSEAPVREKARKLKISVMPHPLEKGPVFSKLTLSPEVGYLFFQKSDMEVEGFKATVEKRNGFIAKLNLGLGGDEVAFDIAPIFAMEFGGIQTDANLDFGQGALGASFQAVGGEVAIVYRFSLGKFFPHLGAGFHGTYLFGNKIAYGTEIYARFPVGLTAYFAEHLAFVLDIGLMYGATGIRTPPMFPEAFDTMSPELRQGLEDAKTQSDFERWYSENQTSVDQWLTDNQDALPEGYTRQQMASDFASEQIGRSIRFGSGFGLDISIGLRFP